MAEARELWERVGGGSNRATVLELFFDLAFVLVLTELSRQLASDLTWPGLFQMVLLTAALWWVWTVVTWLTDVYDSENPGLQLLVIVLTFGVITMAIAIHNAFGDHSLMFASAYVAIHLVRSSALVVVLRGTPNWRRPWRILVWSTVAAPLWLIGAVVGGRLQLVLWVAAVAVDYLSAAIGWPVPGLGRTSDAEWRTTAEHLAERYRQFLIIGVGEAILTMGAAWLETPLTPLRGVALTVSFVFTVLLWQTYYRVAGEQLGQMLARRGAKARGVQLATECHLLMVTGIAISSVSIDLIIRHPTEGHGFWDVIIVGGPALFMLGRVLFGRLVLGRFSPSRVITLVALVILGPVAVLLMPIVTAAVVTAMLFFVQLPRASKKLAQRIHEPVLEDL